MPLDCEINWGKHQVSIKGRNVFGKMFNSSSKHHTGNMKFFLLSVVCLTVALAAPSEKRKRDILPGDPRYGTDYHLNHHHHHENEVEVARSIGSYVGSYSTPDTGIHESTFQVDRGYGVPSFQPGIPLNDYTPSVVDVAKQTSPVSIYDVPDSTVHIPEVNRKYLEPVIQEAKKTEVPTPSYGVPLQKVQTTSVHTHTVKSELNAPTAEAPVTSYGTPVVADVKTVSESSSHDSNVEPSHTIHKMVHTEVHEQKLVEAPKPEVKLTKHAPISQGVTRYTVVDEVPQASIPTTQHEFVTKIGKVPETFSTSHVSQYTPIGGYSNYGLEQQHEYVQTSPLKPIEHQAQFNVPQTLPLQINHLPYAIPVSHFAEIPRPYFVQIPQTYPLEIPQTIPYVQPLTQYVRVKVPLQKHVEVQKTEQVADVFPSTHQTVQLPSYQGIPKAQPVFKVTTETPVHLTAAVKDVHLPSRIDKDSVTIENPVLKSEKTETYTPVPSLKEYVQPTASNGGYVY